MSIRIFLLMILFAFEALADFSVYSTGKWHYFEGKLSSPKTSETFLQEYLPAHERLIWKRVSRISDPKYTHDLYQLYFDGIRVDSHFVKTHWNRAGFMQFATSLWETPWEKNIDKVDTEFPLTKVRNVVHRELFKRIGDFRGRLHFEKVWWADAESETLIPAFRVEAVQSSRGFYKEWFIGGKSDEILEERSLVRHYLATNQNLYLSSPLGMGATFDVEDLDDLDDNFTLKNSFLHVYRDTPVDLLTDPPTLTLDETDPDDDFTAGEFSTSPLLYSGTNCTTCENQQFDAKNTYFHLNSFRQYLDSIHTALGVTASVAALLDDPIAVIVNSLSTDFDESGSGADDTNNAAYFSTTCRDGYGTNFNRCLAILRPSLALASDCGSSPVSLFSVAREGNVIVHEYQHYFTDRITSMIAGSYTRPRVGDALHEGYSDYFGASQVVRISSNTTATQIGAYSFQNCPAIIRDVSVLKVFVNDSSVTDSHVAGLTWASGLWRLRDNYGATYADKLAVNSLFFLSPRPGFREAVEALVRADGVLTGGVRAGEIRTLFYNTLNFTGGESNLFRDPANQIVDVGLHSCLAVKANRTFSWWSLGIFLLWMGGILWLGRRFSP